MYFRCLGVAQEEGKQSVVKVEIQIENLNDSPVRFTQFLYTAVVNEDIGLGETILQVYAIDKDNSKNGNLTTLSFRISDPNFAIDNQGRISALDKLDADQNGNRFFIYKFNVTVSDMIFEDTATVHLR
jgi:hypothetical protein